MLKKLENVHFVENKPYFQKRMYYVVGVEKKVANLLKGIFYVCLQLV